MQKARITLARERRIADVDPRLYGSFIEHLGRAVYGGIYEPGHPRADAAGFREDVLALLQPLRVPIVRYPGGNFVSGYNWEDGIGPAAGRPRRLDLAWRSVEPNTFGTNEFMAWCRKAGTAPMMAVNLGTRGPAEARDLLEYCNHPGGTYWSDLRRKHGFAAPHNVRVWCLGNEMDGPWQTCAKTAEEYGRIACETAKVMRWVDPTVELVACGSSSDSMPTFGAWDRTVLEHTYEHVDYISLHVYFRNKPTLAEFLSGSRHMDWQITEIARIADEVRAKKASNKTMWLSFDEWNVWYHSHERDKHAAPWQEAPPLLEEDYTLADALLVGCLLITLLRHADRVRMACLAQLVNVIAPVMTVTGGGCWRQTIYYPFLHASAWGRGSVLDVAPHAEAYHMPRIGAVPYLEAIATHDENAGTVTVFAVNRHETEPLQLTGDTRDFPDLVAVEHHILTHTDPHAANTAAAPDRVVPHAGGNARVERGTLTATLPPLSWSAIRLRPA